MSTSTDPDPYHWQDFSDPHQRRYVENIWLQAVSLAGVVQVGHSISAPVAHPAHAVVMLADAVNRLDDIIRNGGPLPSRWATHWQRKDSSDERDTAAPERVDHPARD